MNSAYESGRADLYKEVLQVTTEAIPMHLSIKLDSVERLAHAIRMRWPITLEEAQEQNRKGWTLAYYAEESGKVFSSGDAVYGDGALRDAYRLAQQWIEQAVNA